jgi:hypothetical protein
MPARAKPLPSNSSRRAPRRGAAPRKRTRPQAALAPGAVKCRRKFLRIFPGGFHDETYVAWERDYKWNAHKAWLETLDEPHFAALLKRKRYDEIAAQAVKIEARTNLIFSFEKMALRDAIKAPGGARAFALGLYEWLFEDGDFDRWVETVAALPRRQTRVLTWPIATVFGFIAQPRRHLFIKPNVMRAAARKYGFDYRYESRPSARTYANALEFAAQVRRDQRALRPRDMIDIQSFLWVQGSDEYEE